MLNIEGLKKPKFEEEKWAAAAAIQSKRFQAELKKAIKSEKTGKKKYIAHFSFLAYISGVKDGVELCQNHGVPDIDNRKEEVHEKPIE